MKNKKNKPIEADTEVDVAKQLAFMGAALQLGMHRSMTIIAEAFPEYDFHIWPIGQSPVDGVTPSVPQSSSETPSEIDPQIQK